MTLEGSIEIFGCRSIVRDSTAETGNDVDNVNSSLHAKRSLPVAKTTNQRHGRELRQSQDGACPQIALIAHVVRTLPLCTGH